MRIAIISDIHDNLTAFETVLADLRETSPDIVLHGGDPVSGGSSPAEVVDRVRDLGWRGVLGNTDGPRASYLLIDHVTPKIRRVGYDLEREIEAITPSGLPRADWMARTLRAARPQLP